MSVRSGDMRHRITLQTRSATQSADGEQLLAWSDFATRWASIQRATGKEVFAAAQVNGRIPTVFRIRYLAGLSSAMRLVFDNKVYDIQPPVDVDGRREELIITAFERVGEAP